MRTTMLAMILTSCFALALPAAAAAEPQASAANPASELDFLEAGKDYVIRFPEGSNIFKTTRGGITETTYTTSDGKEQPGRPATWSMTVSVTMFQVVRPGTGSWVLLRHPADPDDFAKWEGQRRAQAILASPRREEIAAEPDGEKRLARLQEAADREIKTTETWINLDHAVAIADVPTEDVELKLSVKSAKVE